jgi:hypothetical protein
MKKRIVQIVTLVFCLGLVAGCEPPLAGKPYVGTFTDPLGDTPGDLIRVTLGADNSFVSEKYYSSAWHDDATGTWFLDENQGRVAVFIEEYNSGSGLAPITTGNPEMQIFSCSYSSTKLLLGSAVDMSGNPPQLPGAWRTVITVKSMGSDAVSGEITFNFDSGGTCTLDADPPFGTTFSATADWAAGTGDEIVITNSSDLTNLPDGTYAYEWVGNGLYFSDIPVFESLNGMVIFNMTKQ